MVGEGWGGRVRGLEDGWGVCEEGGGGLKTGWGGSRG